MGRRPTWTKFHVVRRLRKLKKQGADLSPAARLAAKDPVYKAAERLFGNYGQALLMAGIEPGDVYRLKIGKLDDLNPPATNRWTEAEQIGKRIRVRRTELKMSQKRAAEECGLSESAIANYECGIRVPNAVAAAKLARGLRLRAADLLLSKPTGSERWELLISLFSRLTAAGQEQLLTYAEELAREVTTPSGGQSGATSTASIKVIREPGSVSQGGPAP